MSNRHIEVIKTYRYEERGLGSYKDVQVNIQRQNVTSVEDLTIEEAIDLHQKLSVVIGMYALEGVR